MEGSNRGEDYAKIRRLDTMTQLYLRVVWPSCEAETRKTGCDIDSNELLFLDFFLCFLESTTAKSAWITHTWITETWVMAVWITAAWITETCAT
jgi:hypothetical protein